MKKRHLLPILLIALVLYLVPQLRAGEANQAALVIDFGGGDVQSACVSFPEAEISGYELLQRSSFAIESEIQGVGAVVCSINSTGCPSSNCWCQCAGGGSCVYWSYWHLVGGSWQYSQAGAGQYPVRNGAVEGWVWGPGSVSDATPPPLLTFDDVCMAATATHTPTIPPTGTPQPLPTQPPPTAVLPSPTASNTPLPSRTPPPTPTAVFTATTTTAQPTAAEPSATATALQILPTNTATRQVLFTEPTPVPPTAILISPTPFPSVTPIRFNPDLIQQPTVQINGQALDLAQTPQGNAASRPNAGGEQIFVNPLEVTATFTPLPNAIGANRPATNDNVAVTPENALAAEPETAVSTTTLFAYASFAFIICLLAAALLLTRRRT